MVFLKVFSSFIRRFKAFFPKFKNKSGKKFRSHVPKMGTYGSKRLEQNIQNQMMCFQDMIKNCFFDPRSTTYRHFQCLKWNLLQNTSKASKQEHSVEQMNDKQLVQAMLLVDECNQFQQHLQQSIHQFIKFTILKKKFVEFIQWIHIYSWTEAHKGGDRHSGDRPQWGKTRWGTRALAVSYLSEAKAKIIMLNFFSLDLTMILQYYDNLILRYSGFSVLVLFYMT